jgi:tripartite ATP-independent transporter DctP family solute receptor
MTKTTTMLTALFASAVALSTAAGAETLRLAHESPETHAKGTWADWFAEALAEETGGEITVDVFHHGQLYESEQAAIEATIGGLIDIAIPSTGYMSSVVPEFEVVDLPMMFADQEALYRFQDGELGQELLGLVEPRGLLGLGYISNVPLDLFSKEPLATLEDFSGKRIRAHSAVLEETVAALGGNPVSMRAAELYLAIEQGIVDGAFTTVAFAAPNRYEEVTPYLTQVAVSAIAYPVVINANRFNGLSAEHQQAVRNAAAAATQRNRDALAEQSQAHVQSLVDGGIELVALSDEERARWQESLGRVYDAVAQRVDPELIERVRNLE